MPRPPRFVLAFVAALSFVPALRAQRATPMARLDLKQFTGTWYEVAGLPNKAEKKCVSDTLILYALSDAKRSFQQGLFCKIKNGDAQNANRSGKQDKTGSGELKVTRFLFLSTKYLVLAADPAYTWALVGTPNHKILWLLARSPTLDPATRLQLESTATAQGYKTEKLRSLPRTVVTFRAEAGAPTGQGQGHAVSQGKPAATTP